MNETQKFYDSKFSHGDHKQLGFMSILRSFFLRFERHRIEVTATNFPVGISKYLDIGCGNGNLLFTLRNKFKQGVGIDVSPLAIKQAIRKANKENLSNKIKFIVVNANDKLPFKSGSFDVVTIIAVLEHVFDPYLLMSEARRVLKKNGLLFVEVPNIAWFPHRFGLFFGKRPRTSYDPGWDGGHLQYFTFSDLEKLCITTGFSVIKRDSSGVFKEIRNIYPQLLSGDIFLVCKNA